MHRKYYVFAGTMVLSLKYSRCNRCRFVRNFTKHTHLQLTFRYSNWIFTSIRIRFLHIVHDEQWMNGVRSWPKHQIRRLFRTGKISKLFSTVYFACTHHVGRVFMCKRNKHGFPGVICVCTWGRYRVRNEQGRCRTIAQTYYNLITVRTVRGMRVHRTFDNNLISVGLKNDF